MDAPEWPIPTGKYIGWRLLFAFTLVPALLQAFLLSFLVESPRHLVSLGDYEQARRAVQKLRGQLDVESEIEHLISVHERDVQLQQQAVGLKQLCTQRQFRRPLLISVVAMLSQQLSGINAVMQFSTDIFSKVMGAAERYAKVVATVTTIHLLTLPVHFSLPSYFSAQE